MHTMNERLRQFIVQNFPVARSVQLHDDDPLLEKGVLDSLGILDLVTFVEKEWQVSLADEDLIPDHFQSITCLAKFLHTKYHIVG